MRQELSIFELGGRKPVLSGSVPGRMFFGKLTSAVERQEQTQALYLNFRGVQVVTGSFFRDGILAFRDHCLRERLNLYPVIANVTTETLDELKIALEVRGDAVVVCNLDARSRVGGARVVGPLEEKQQVTLEAVVREQEADATTLRERYREAEPIGVTGWNNRLAALAEKGLLMELKKGRGKVYRPVVEMG